ncbi:phosphopantetheine-binding protein [Nocardia asiatica]|uniref:phosphopantetheine-binding protein n=1 Tax=Nocardia asiatica TaxID=209252 RepID=UPI0024562169|nr:phosphopantetheine-binding protein [Nocardia asiatica]
MVSGCMVNEHSDIRALVESVWLELLNVDHVDSNSDFFESGGSSLTAARFIEAMEHSIGIPVRLVQFLRSRTLSGLVDLYSRELSERNSSAADSAHTSPQGQTGL